MNDMASVYVDERGEELPSRYVNGPSGSGVAWSVRGVKAQASEPRRHAQHLRKGMEIRNTRNTRLAVVENGIGPVVTRGRRAGGCRPGPLAA